MQLSKMTLLTASTLCLALAAACSADPGGSETIGDAQLPVFDAGADVGADALAADAVDAVGAADSASDVAADTAVDVVTDAAADTAADVVADDIVADTVVADDAGDTTDDAGDIGVADVGADTASDVGADAPDTTTTMGWSGNPIPLADYAATKLAEVCKTLLVCQGKPGVPAFSTYEGCVALLGAEGTAVIDADLTAAAGKGLLGYSATIAGFCVKSLTYDCGAYALGGADACGLAFEGTVADGGNCTILGACKTGFCDLPETGCPGVCKPKAGAGGSCVYQEACQVGLACVQGKCVDASPVGVTKPCAYNLPCGVGLWCAYVGGKGACLPIGDVGASCNASIGCKTGLSCDVIGGTCVTPAALGAPCTDSGGFGDANACVAGAVCVPDGTGKAKAGVCAAKAALGGKCVSTLQCGALDLNCLGAVTGNGTCVAVPKAGQACEAPDFKLGTIYACTPPAFCFNKLCTVLPTTGKACLTGLESSGCAAGLVCESNGICGALPKLGQPCTFGCADGLQCTQKSGAWVCQKPNCP